MESLTHLAVTNPPVVVAVALGLWAWSRRAKGMAAAGALGRFAGLARLGVVGVMLAAALVALLANRRTRHATVTVLCCLGVVVSAVIAWVAPVVAVQMLLPAAFAGALLALWPDTGPVARWLDGAPILSVQSWRYASERGRQRRVLAEAVARSGGLPVVGATAVVDGTATVRVAVPAGANPHALDGAADTITNAVNVLAQREGADLTAVAARVERNPDGVVVHVDTQPRRLPQRVEWPGVHQ